MLRVRLLVGVRGPAVSILCVSCLSGPTASSASASRLVPPEANNGSLVPFDAPSSVRFLETRLIVANQSYFTGATTHHAVLDLEAGEEGLPEFIPPAPTPPAAGATQPVKRRRKHRYRHHGGATSASG